MDRNERFKQLLLERGTPEFLLPQENRVLVYGSLKMGHHNHGLMSGAEFICKGMSKGGNFKMVGMKGGFPGVTWGQSRIVGEIYAVSDLHLELLDCLEGEGVFYKRHQCRVRVRSGTSQIRDHMDHNENQLAWIYVLYDDFKDALDPADPAENVHIIRNELEKSEEWSFVSP